MIQFCGVCRPHEQDNIHGLNRRVMNPTGKDPTRARCTVCGALATIKKAEDTPARKEKK